MIEVSGLCKQFGAAIAVDDVSFTVERGQVVGLLGPNGAGKTTTMRILTTFMPPDRGRATVAGFDIAAEPLQVRRRIGYLPENSPLYLDMMVFEYLEYIATVRGIPRRARLSQIRRVIELTGLTEVMNKEIGQLSKGYRQRVGLAQTLIHEPEILILDEPTTGLDPNQIVEIRDLIKEMGRERTVILSTHILSEVEATCGRVIIIDGGKVVASGTPDELAARARGGSFWQLTLRAPPDPAVQAVRSIAGVHAAEILADERGLVRLRITAAGDDAIGEAIFHKVAAGGWSLVELRRDQASLEHIFRQLTGKDGPAS